MRTAGNSTFLSLFQEISLKESWVEQYLLVANMPNFLSLFQEISLKEAFRYLIDLAKVNKSAFLSLFQEISLKGKCTNSDFVCYFKLLTNFLSLFQEISLKEKHRVKYVIITKHFPLSISFSRDFFESHSDGRDDAPSAQRKEVSFYLFFKRFL